MRSGKEGGWDPNEKGSWGSYLKWGPWEPIGREPGDPVQERIIGNLWKRVDEE